METKTLTAWKIRHYPDKGGFFVGESNLGPIVGTADFISSDVTMIAEGEWQNSAAWGRQFRIRSFRYASMADSMKALFASGFLKGI